MSGGRRWTLLKTQVAAHFAQVLSDPRHRHLEVERVPRLKDVLAEKCEPDISESSFEAHGNARRPDLLFHLTERPLQYEELVLEVIRTGNILA